MHILLVRHGQTDQNVRGVLQGHSPATLNDVGRRQALALAARLRSFNPRPTSLVSSDLQRAVDTATPIAKVLGLDVKVDPVWRERSFGAFEGRTLGEAEIWRAAAGSLDLPGSEPVHAFQARIQGALLALVRDAWLADGCVGVITHGGPIRTVLRLLSEGSLTLADPTDRREVASVGNASITGLRALPQAGGIAWQITAVNEAAHLVESVQPRPPAPLGPTA